MMKPFIIRWKKCVIEKKIGYWLIYRISKRWCVAIAALAQRTRSAKVQGRSLARKRRRDKNSAGNGVAVFILKPATRASLQTATSAGNVRCEYTALRSCVKSQIGS